MKRYPVLTFFIILLFLQCRQQSAEKVVIPQVKYELSFPNRLHHEADIKIIFKDLPQNPLVVHMSRSSPGRYILHDFVKNVYGEKITDSTGQSLHFQQPNPHTWQIEHNGEVIFQYKLYGNRLNGTNSMIKDQYVLLNIPSTLVWPANLSNPIIRLQVEKPVEEWKIITQLDPIDQNGLFFAPDLNYLMDSPIAIGDFTIRKWQHSDKKTNFALAALHRGKDQDITDIADMTKMVITQQHEVMGEFPEFFQDHYFFILFYLPEAENDGMEHRNSTVITNNNQIAWYKRKFLTTISHEFFHSWITERLRPASITPFNYLDINSCPELWFAEGVVTYYDDVFLTRAGIREFYNYANGLTYHLNKIINLPGKTYTNPAKAGLLAPILDGSESQKPENTKNIHTSYYDYGDVISLALDLMLRTQFQEKKLSLDHYIQLLWSKYGKSETPYDNQMLEETLTQLTGDPQFSKDFFQNYIYSNQLPDFNHLLNQAGIAIKEKYTNKAWLGDVDLSSAYGGAYITAPTLHKTPLYNAGLDQGDIILYLGNQRIYNAPRYYQLMYRFKPGQTVKIIYLHNGKRKESMITFTKDNEIEVFAYELLNRQITDEIKEFRKSWLGVKTNQ
ncbi:MAG: PDZ domain-containing protein [Spirochaetes bacterium]|nr:PDZ domain-containing protein [Spirochaetota bacterium]